MNHERDALTGLYNRHGLAQLEHAIVEARQQGNTAALLFADIDRFKSLNEVFGHLNGDRVLCEFAKLLQSIVADKGKVCRVGGDDFVVVLPQASAADAQEVADQICDSLAKQPLEVEGHAVHITVAIGVASYPADGSEASSLLDAADVAMWESKKSRRLRTVIVDGKPLAIYD